MQQSIKSLADTVGKRINARTGVLNLMDGFEALREADNTVVNLAIYNAGSSHHILAALWDCTADSDETFLLWTTDVGHVVLMDWPQAVDTDALHLALAACMKDEEMKGLAYVFAPAKSSYETLNRKVVHVPSSVGTFH